MSLYFVFIFLYMINWLLRSIVNLIADMKHFDQNIRKIISFKVGIFLNLKKK